ncbi:ATP-binding cassette domain-containing protein [Streptomyces sp. NPDC049687]|uniref:ABC transporter ATP-binding protein n=1 Tax=Streptomyces sp. NPDC049687 TaxID=3365596 RepID=UPI0037AA7D8F
MIQAFGLTSDSRKELPPAVDDVSFEARAGSVTVLLGAPGAGKSTALRLMLELQQGRGLTYFRGRPLHRIAHPSREVGVLLGDVPGHPARTVRGHLRMLCAAAGVPVRRADEVLEVVGLVSLRDERLGTLSLGMDRRLGLACALLADPHTLVLDEPTKGLNGRENRWLHGMLRAHAAHGGTVLMTTANPKEAAHTADRVVTLDKGRLVADQEAADFARTRLRPRVAVRSPHATRLAALLTREARTGQRSVEVVQEDGNRLCVYGSTCAEVGETAFRHGILVHQLADETGDMGPGAGAGTGAPWQTGPERSPEPVPLAGAGEPGQAGVPEPRPSCPDDGETAPAESDVPTDTTSAVTAPTRDDSPRLARTPCPPVEPASSGGPRLSDSLNLSDGLQLSGGQHLAEGEPPAEDAPAPDFESAHDGAPAAEDTRPEPATTADDGASDDAMALAPTHQDSTTLEPTTATVPQPPTTIPLGHAALEPAAEESEPPTESLPRRDALSFAEPPHPARPLPPSLTAGEQLTFPEPVAAPDGVPTDDLQPSAASHIPTSADNSLRCSASRTPDALSALPPPISVRSAPSPLRPLRYELRRAAGISTGFVTGAAVLLSSALIAVLLARMGHTSQARLLAAWPVELPLPPAALGAGLLGALAFGDEFRHPALAVDRGTVPRRLGLLGAKLLVAGLTALMLAFLTVGCDAEVLYLLHGREFAKVPADWLALSTSWLALVVGCAWAGVLAAGVFRSTTAGLAAVLAVPVLVVPVAQRAGQSGSVRTATGFSLRLREVLLVQWPFGGERYLFAAARVIAQPVGGALALSLATLMCAYLLTALRGRVR